jgi:serine/threonine-protein kinase RsbW
MNTNALQIEVVIPTQTRYLDLIGSIGERIAKEVDHFSGDREELAYHLNLVLTEAATNAIKHGNYLDPKDTVRVAIHIQANQLIVRVYDHGQGFDLENVPLPDFDDPKESGMGLFFIRALTDKVTYTKQGDCNVLEITKRLD